MLVLELQPADAHGHTYYQLSEESLSQLGIANRARRQSDATQWLQRRGSSGARELDARPPNRRCETMP